MFPHSQAQIRDGVAKQIEMVSLLTQILSVCFIPKMIYRLV